MRRTYLIPIIIILAMTMVIILANCKYHFLPIEEKSSNIYELESVSNNCQKAFENLSSVAAESDVALKKLNATLRQEHISEMAVIPETTTEEKTTTEEVYIYDEPEEVDVVEPDNYEEPENEDYEPDDYFGEYAGTFELTAYEWTGQPMANGEYPYYGCCASNYFALGTVLYIEGYGTFVVKDRGGMADNVIDIYLGDPDACWEFGRKFGVHVYYA